MMPVVRIIADRPVRYSLNNGYTMCEYDPGQLYEVPPFVVYGMLARGWAEVVNPADLAKAAQSADKPADEAPPEPKSDDGDKRKKAR